MTIQEMAMCDECGKHLAEPHTRELEQFISLERGRDSNLWMGDIGSWLWDEEWPGSMEGALHFCTFEHFVTWLLKWHRKKEIDKSAAEAMSNLTLVIKAKDK